MDQPAPLALLAWMEPQAPQVQQALQVQVGLQVQQDHKAALALLDLLAHQGPQDQLDRRGLPALPVLQGL